MSNDLELHVGTTADSSGLKSAADELDKTKHSSDDMGKAFHEAGAESHDLDEALAKMRESSDGAGTSFREQAKGAHSLDEELAKLRLHLTGLQKAYATTGDRTLFKDIRSDRSLIGALERIKKDLKDVENEGGKATRATRLLESTAGSAIGALSELGSAFTKSVGSTFSGLSDVAGPLKGALIAGAVAAAAEISPLIVGAIGGAISTAVGVGGIAVGLVSAAKDPAVKAAISTFGRELSDEFTAVGKPFVRPFQEAIGILSADIKSLRLSDVFADAAPAVTGLAHTVGDFAKSVMPGFDAALQRSAPYMDQLDRGLATVGDGLSSLLDDVSASPGDLQAFRQALDLIGAGLALTGKAIAAAGDAWHLLNHEWANFYHALGQALFTMPDIAHQFTSLGDRLDAYDKIGDHAIATTDLFGATVGATSTQTHVLASSLDTAAIAAQRYSVALEGAATSDDALAKRHALNQAILAEKQGWIDLSKALDSKQGLNLQEQQAIESQAAALDRERQAAIAAGDNTVAAQDKAVQAYDKGIERLLAMAKAAGATPAELAKIKSDYYVTIHEHVDRRVHEASDTRQFLGTAPHRAGGGSVLGGVPYSVNERAGKEVYFPAGGRVAPANLTPAWGSSPVRHIIDLRINGNTIRVLAIDDALARGVAPSTIAVAYP